MDYLDPRKQFRHRIIMLVGYVCITVAIVIATFVLVYQAYGFGLGKNGTVIQSGLLFVSSQPHPAHIYLNGKLNKTETNARLVLPANIYSLVLKRAGYRNWQRTVAVDGGRVEHFDYPLLIPDKLSSSKIGDAYSGAPGLVTQSPDRRWLLIQRADSVTDFDLYDLKNPTKAATLLSLPATLLTKTTDTDSWQLVSWADDNQHLILQHTYGTKHEFILVDRSTVSQSINLDTLLKSTPDELTLDNRKYDQYYLYDTANQTLQTASLKSPTPTGVLSDVLAYQTYGSNQLLYVTAADAPSGKVLLKLLDGNQTYILHSFPADTTYVVDLTTYAGTLYVVAGAAAENKVYVYKDPLGQLNAQTDHAVVPVQVLRVPNPSYVSFSNTAQFIMAESGKQFGVYDIQNQIGYNYIDAAPLDSPQLHASWVDGDRLSYVSNGKLIIFDYDQANQQSLVAANPAYLPAFSSDFKFLYSLSPDGATPAATDLEQTSLLTPADR